MTAEITDPKGRARVPFESIEPGLEVGTFSYVLDDNSVDRHLRATEQEAYPEAYAPVSLLAADGVNLSDRFYDISQSVHAGQRLDILALPRLGSTLTVSGRSLDKFVRRGRRFVSIETTTTDDAGVRIATGVTTGVIVYGETEGGGAAPKPEEEVSVIETLPPLERVMTREAMVLYEPEGERNIHTDDDFARAVGLPASIATGTLFLAYVFDLLYRRYGFASIVGSSIDVRIRAPVFAGDRVVAGGEVVERGTAGDRLRVRCVGPHGTVISGSASVRSTG
jgi:acyl dehydratase